jgi:trehalose 6-phosphate phosphatase
LDLIFAGNHGLEIGGRGLNFVHGGARLVRASIQKACELLKLLAARWPGAWVEDEGLTLTLHFRQVEHPLHESLLAAARFAIQHLGAYIKLHLGKQALEVHRGVHWDKGDALGYIRAMAGPYDACICIGDEDADESMFRANRRCLNIRVGRAQGTVATHCVSDSTALATVLSHLVNTSGSGTRLAWRPVCAEATNSGGFVKHQHG